MSWELRAGKWDSQVGSDMPVPYVNYCSLLMPDNIQDALRWCEHVALHNGLYASALNRIISYFLTRVDIVDDDIGDDERVQWEELYEEISSIELVREFDRNYLVSGNVFVSVIDVIKRFLVCPNKECGAEFALDYLADMRGSDYRFANWEFHARCPTCEQSGKWDRRDRRRIGDGSLAIVFWSPLEIDIKHHPLTKQNAYIWKIPEDVRKQVREGHVHIMESMPWEVVDAIKNNQDFEFDSQFIFHHKATGLASQRMRGWGFSEVMSNLRHAWYVEMLFGQNEAIARDFIVPWRVISPDTGVPPGGQEQDPIGDIDLGGHSRMILNMIEERRRNPTKWFHSPIALKYMLMGGEAKQLVPFDLINQATEMLLNCVGFPVEMHKANMQAQAMPGALRLFESTWSHLVSGNNKFLEFMTKRIARIRGIEAVKSRMARTTVIDDLQDHAYKLQLMASQAISQSTGLSAINLDWKTEMRRTLEEQRYLQETTAKIQREMNMAALGEQMAQPPPQPPPGGAAPGGAGSAPGGAPGQTAAISQSGTPQAAGGPYGVAALTQAINTPIDPNQYITMNDLTQAAQAKAQEMNQMPDGQRQSAMTRLKHQNPGLWMATRTYMDEVNQQARTQGKNMLMQQQQQGGGAPA